MKPKYCCGSGVDSGGCTLRDFAPDQGSLFCAFLCLPYSFWSASPKNVNQLKEKTIKTKTIKSLKTEREKGGARKWILSKKCSMKKLCSKFGPKIVPE